MEKTGFIVTPVSPPSTLAVLPGDVPGGIVGTGVGGEAGQLGLPPPGAATGLISRSAPLAPQLVASEKPATQLPSQTPVPVLLKHDESAVFSLKTSKSGFSLQVDTIKVSVSIKFPLPLKLEPLLTKAGAANLELLTQHCTAWTALPQVAK